MKIPAHWIGSWALPIVLVLSAGLSACAGGNASLSGRIVIEGERSHGNFAVSPLVHKADDDLTSLLGHAVSFRFDAAMVPKWQEHLEALSESGIDSVAHALADLKEHQPGMFAWAAPKLRQVEWDYSATEKETHFTFDVDTGVLKFVLSSESSSDVDVTTAIRHAIGRGYGRAQGARFAGKDPASLADSERQAYAEWLFEFAYGVEAERQASQAADAKRGGQQGEPADTIVDAARARVLLRMIALDAIAQLKDAPLHVRIRTALMKDAEYLASTRKSKTTTVSHLPAGHDFLRAEAAFAAWLNANEASLPTADRVTIATALQDYADDDGTVHAFPGFDVTAHFFRVLQEWQKAGEPTSVGGVGSDVDRTQMDLWSLVLGVQRQYGNDDGYACHPTRYPVYMQMKRDDALRARAFQTVLARKSAPGTRMLMQSLLGMTPIDTALSFWHATEADPAAFMVTSRVLAGFTRCCHQSSDLYDQLPAMWQKYPARHGLLAYVLFAYETEGYRDSFTRVFHPLAQAEVAAMMDLMADPLHELHFFWRWFGPGWSRMDVFEPRLEAWAAMSQYKEQGWFGELLGVVARDLCAEGSRADFVRLGKWVEKRTQTHPSDIPRLYLAIQGTAAEKCPLPRGAPSPKGASGGGSGREGRQGAPTDF